MKIQNYKYNAETFEQEAYELMKKRADADKELTKQEKIAKKDVNNLSLSYYKAYLNYMHQDNQHMGSFLAYIKHEFEMTRRTIPLFFNNDEVTLTLQDNVNKTQQAFDFYSKIYEDLKKLEFELKEAIQSFQDQKFEEDAMNLFSLQLIMMKLNDSYLILQNTAEMYRENFGFPLVEKCLADRNVGLEFETYSQRSEKIVKEVGSEPIV